MTYEKRAVCPNGVQFIIDIANLIPHGIDPPNPFDHKYELEDKPGWFGIISSAEENLRRFRERLAAYPKLVDHLKDAKSESRLIEDYEFFLTVRSVLNLIVERSEDYRKHLSEGEVWWYHDPVNIPFQLWINWKNDGLHNGTNDGKIRFEGSVITKILEGCELIRFRRCRVCKCIFWAKKLNAESCQKKCSDTLGNWNRQGKPRQRPEIEISVEISQARIDSRKRFLSQDFGKT